MSKYEKRNIAIYILLAVSFFFVNSNAHAKKEIRKVNFNRQAVMRSPSGKIEKITTDNTKHFAGIQSIFAKEKIKPKSHLCGKLRARTITNNLSQIESRLEVDILLDNLKKAYKPRSLSYEQKLFLAEIPTCGTFLLDLEIIGKLLQGYDLIDFKTE